MTVELVLLLSLYAFIVMGAMLGPLGPIETFKKSAPRLAARVERNISIGNGFRQSASGEAISWHKSAQGK
jgi:hypothetical protein